MKTKKEELHKLWAEIPYLRKAEADARTDRLDAEAEARKLFREIMLECHGKDCSVTCESYLCLDVRAMPG